MNLIKTLSARIEQDHARKLQEMSTSAPSVGSRNDFMNFGAPTGRVNGFDDSNGDTNDFESLVLGKSKLGDTQSSFDTWGSSAAPTLQPSMPSQPQGTSPTPTFSWSTPPTFGVIQPQSRPLQPSVLSPTSPTPSTSSTRPVDWASANTTSWTTSNTGSSSVASNPWSSNINSPPTNISSNPWGSSSQPQISSLPLGQPQRPNMMTQSSFSIPPPSTSPYSTFSIAPPPTMNTLKPNTPGTLNGLARGQNQQKSSNQKSGLDKYESLI
jgi:SCY1-like protein 2